MATTSNQNAPRTVVVTGGSKGIGEAICRQFAGADTRVFFNYSSDDTAARQTEKKIRDDGFDASGLQVNVAVEKEVTAFFDHIIKETGKIDVLVNNAGITRDGLLVRMKEKDWDDVIDINLKGAFNCTKYAAKSMIRNRYGRIVNVTSVVGASGNPGQANYVASKAGLIGFTKAMARELAPKNITVNAVAPGYVETEMTGSLPDRAKDAMKAQIPLGRPGTAEEVAATVAFLASEAASYITGQVFHVSGGMYM